MGFSLFGTRCAFKSTTHYTHFRAMTRCADEKRTLSRIRSSFQLRLWSTLPRWTESVHDGYRVDALPRRVGVHITAFGARSSFTRVTARRIARPPFVDFFARLRPARLPGPAARQLSNPTINDSSGPSPTGIQPLWGTRGSACPTLGTPRMHGTFRKQR